MQNYEKLGVFYLGRELDPATGDKRDDLVLYNSKDLTTHAMIVGMTGSGKTGLALAMIEEAAIDGIPSLLIDPKGDLGNLLLQFPNLAAGDFAPWIDAEEAQRKGISPDELAARTASTWKKGLASWDQDGDRIRRLLDAADLAIYTPGNAAGRPLRILRSFAAPPPELVQDASALRDHVMFAVSGLLGLIGISGDPLQCREHILISSILDHTWRSGQDLELEDLIRSVQKPPFEQVGVFDLETFYPARDRLKLAMSLNHLLASPGFSAWREGEPLDIDRLLYTPSGKPRCSVLSIAHLGDAERMFFVTALLNETIAWMRRQSGTTSLRAMLYMDEIFGFFPPTANPPSKEPMLTLLKQARAFGLGIVLSTQNPVDLDYKGLGNCGTWFLGRLQTERDKQRVLDGLEGVAAGADATFDRGQTERLLAQLGSRVFLMRNVHDNQPTLFETRWVMSYMRGPLTLPQIRQLCPPAPAEASPAAPAAPAAAPQAEPPAAAAQAPQWTPGTTPPPAAAIPVPEAPAAPAVAPAVTPTASRPALPADLPEFFLTRTSAYQSLPLQPKAVGSARLHFVNARSKTDTWITRSFLAPIIATGEVLWEEAELTDDLRDRLQSAPPAGATFGSLPPAAIHPRTLANWRKLFAAYLYQDQSLKLLHCPATKLVSNPDETEGEFRSRAAFAQREQRDERVEKVKASYALKIQRLEDQLRRANERVERTKAQATQHRVNTALSFGATILGALVGKRGSVGTVSRATTAMRGASRIGKAQGDVARADESAEVLQERLNNLNREFEDELDKLRVAIDSADLELEEIMIRPRKTDITITTRGLCWSSP